MAKTAPAGNVKWIFTRSDQYQKSILQYQKSILQIHRTKTSKWAMTNKINTNTNQMPKLNQHPHPKNGGYNFFNVLHCPLLKIWVYQHKQVKRAHEKNASVINNLQNRYQINSTFRHNFFAANHVLFIHSKNLTSYIFHSNLRRPVPLKEEWSLLWSCYTN